MQAEPMIVSLRILPLDAKDFARQGMLAISIVGSTYVAGTICDGVKPACGQTKARLTTLSVHHWAFKLTLLFSSSHWQTKTDLSAYVRCKELPCHSGVTVLGSCPLGDLLRSAKTTHLCRPAQLRPVGLVANRQLHSVK